MPSFVRLLNPITFFLFIPLSILLFILQHALQRLGLDAGVLFTGNVLLYLITTAALYFHYKGMQQKNPNAFFRNVYASMILRMFICILLVLVYVWIVGNSFNKPSLLLCFVFYFLYSFVEAGRITLALKKMKDV